MADSAASLQAQLLHLFPQRELLGPAVECDCEECVSLYRALQGNTWGALTPEFLQEHSDRLPLLSKEAYAAFLPAWLREASSAPDSEVATMLLVNLRGTPPPEGFTADQRCLVAAFAREVIADSFWGPNDPVHVDSLIQMEALWCRHPTAGVSAPI